MTASEVSQSVTRVIWAVRGDRASAVGPLLAVYFEPLVQLARKRLHDLPGMPVEGPGLHQRGDCVPVGLRAAHHRAQAKTHPPALET
jgi:hypothetical protein